MEKLKDLFIQMEDSLKDEKTSEAKKKVIDSLRRGVKKCEKNEKLYYKLVAKYNKHIEHGGERIKEVEESIEWLKEVFG